jgi:hypothetical protein
MNVIAQLPGWFRTTKIGAQAVKEFESKARAERKPLIDALPRQRAAVLSRREARDRQIAESLAVLRPLREQLATAERAHAELGAALGRVVYDAELAVERTMRDLAASADPRIEAAIADVVDWQHRHGRRLHEEWTVPSGRVKPGHLELPEYQTVSNEAAIRRLLDVQRETRARLEELKYRDLGADDVEAAIAEVMQPLEAARAAVKVKPDLPTAA